MLRLLFTILTLISAACGQSYTTISGQVLDPSGAYYSNGRLNVSYAQGAGCTGIVGWKGTSVPLPFTVYSTTLDSTGNITAFSLPPNSALNCTTSKWTFNVCSTSNVCFSTDITITGTAQSVTSTLQSAAHALNTSLIVPPYYTVATLPTVGAKGTTVIVGDGSSATDCTSGSGSTVVSCMWNGSAWVANGGGGGSGTVTHTGALTAGKVMLGNGTADSKVDSALTSNGSGTITGAVSITSTNFVGAIDGILGGNTPAAATVTGLTVNDGSGKAGIVSLINGTAQTPAANSFGIFAPASITTGFAWSAPAAENGSAGVVKVAAASSHVSALTVGTVGATELAAQYSKGSCTEVWGGSGTSFALTSGDDAISNNSCYNDSGVTRTITAVKCASDNGTNTTTVNPTFGSAGTGTTILSGALTCGSSNAMSSSGTVSNASWTTGAGINPAMGGTLTGTHIVMIVEFTY